MLNSIIEKIAVIVAARVLLAALILTGCTTTGTPIPEPEQVHCDLIFPAPSRT